MSIRSIALVSLLAIGLMCLWFLALGDIPIAYFAVAAVFGAGAGLYLILGGWIAWLFAHTIVWVLRKMGAHAE